MIASIRFESGSIDTKKFDKVELWISNYAYLRKGEFTISTLDYIVYGLHYHAEQNFQIIIFFK